MAKKNNKNRKRTALQLLLGGILILILVNIAIAPAHLQADLTADQRYTNHKATLELLRTLSQPVRISLYLSGNELPAGFKKLSKATEQKLQTMVENSKGNLSYQIIKTEDADSLTLQKMMTNKLQGIPVTVDNGKKGTEQRLVWPYVLVESNGRSVPVILQQATNGPLTKQAINESEIALEYNIASAIQQATKLAPDTVAYLLGNGQPDKYSIYDLATTLATQYKFEVIGLNDYAVIPQRYKTVIVNAPNTEWSDIDKYKLDQYLMKGGKLLMMIDGVAANLDSLGASGGFTAVPIQHNLTDLFFTYGLRINPNVLGDADQCVDIQLSRAGQDGQPVASAFKWPYYPIMERASEQAIVANINEVLGKFVSNIESVNDNPAITKTPLLQTGKYTKAEAAPLPVVLMSATIAPNRTEFKSGHLITGILLEGTFTSLFANRNPEKLSSFIAEHSLKTMSKSIGRAKMVVYSDGDIFQNEMTSKGPSEMGMYRFSGYRFNNKALLLNTMSYLTDTLNLLSARSKSYSASILDMPRVEDERSLWQWINIGVPVILVLIGGSVYTYLRRRKYTY